MSIKKYISKNKDNIKKLAAGSAGAAGVVGGLGVAKAAQVTHDVRDVVDKSFKEGSDYKLLKNIAPRDALKYDVDAAIGKESAKAVRDLGLTGAGIGGAILAGVMAKHHFDKKKKKAK